MCVTLGEGWGGRAFVWAVLLSQAPLQLLCVILSSWLLWLISHLSQHLSFPAIYRISQVPAPHASGLCRFPFCRSAAAGTGLGMIFLYSCPSSVNTARGMAGEDVCHPCHEWQQGFAQGMVLIPAKIQPFGEGTHRGRISPTPHPAGELELKGDWMGPMAL